jgi:hypothetical protein
MDIVIDHETRPVLILIAGIILVYVLDLFVSVTGVFKWIWRSLSGRKSKADSGHREDSTY